MLEGREEGKEVVYKIQTPVVQERGEITDSYAAVVVFLASITNIK